MIGCETHAYQRERALSRPNDSTVPGLNVPTTEILAAVAPLRGRDRPKKLRPAGNKRHVCGKRHGRATQIDAVRRLRRVRRRVNMDGAVQSVERRDELLREARDRRCARANAARRSIGPQRPPPRGRTSTVDAGPRRFSDVVDVGTGIRWRTVVRGVDRTRRCTDPTDRASSAGIAHILRLRQ